MSNCHDRERLWSLIIDALDNLEQLSRARELTNIFWDISITQTEQDWQRTEVLLESYEKMRDKSLDNAMSNLRELVAMINNSNQ